MPERRRLRALPLRWCCSLALMMGVGAGLGLTGMRQAHAGNQKEEALADSVRLALSTAIRDSRPPQPAFHSQAERATYENWMQQMSSRLERKLPDRQSRLEFLQVAWYESRRAGLDPGMVLGLIQVESAYRKYAVSMVGARGYMQVMPFWSRQIGDGDASRLFHMQTNLRFGCVILRHYLQVERGDLFMALGRYNGSRGRADYPNLIFGARRQWTLPTEPARA